jgi:hypothetical protein
MKLTVDPATEHTEGVPEEKDTASPEEATAETAYVGPPTLGELGGVEVKVICCDPLPTATDCCTCAAGWYSALPAWLASIVHVPVPMKLTVDSASEHTEGVPEEKDTASPEEATADTAYVGPPTLAEVGGLEVNSIVCVLPDPPLCGWNAPSPSGVPTPEGPS